MTRTASQIVADLRAKRGPQVEQNPHAYDEPLTRAGAERAHRARGTHAVRMTPAALAAFLTATEARP